MNVDELLAEARAGLERVSPGQTHAALDAGAVVVDIRPSESAAATARSRART